MSAPIPGLRVEPVNQLDCPFEYLFAPAFERWRELVVVDQYPIRYHDNGDIADPVPELVERYGVSGLLHVCPEMALAASRGAAIPHWAAGLLPAHSYLLLFFLEAPSCPVIEYYYYMGKRDLARGRWPPGLRDVVQCYEGEFWEIHSHDSGLLERIAAHHVADPRIEVTQVQAA